MPSHARHTGLVIPIFMALTPVPFAISYIWRTGAHPEPGIDTARSRALATGAVLGALFALVVAALLVEDGFGFFAAFVAVGIVAWLAVALDQGDLSPKSRSGRPAQNLQRGMLFICGLAIGAFFGALPWLALILVLRSA